MAWRLLIIPLLLIIFVSAGCPPSQKISDQPAKIPQGLLKLETIEGELFGQELDRPHGLAVNQEGGLYLVDAGNGRIIRFDKNLRGIRDHGGVGFVQGLLNNPTFISLDNNLNLFVSDAGNQRISVYDASLNFVEEILFEDEDDPLKFGRPSGLITDRFGELWVVDYDKGQLVIYDNVKQPDRIIGSSEDDPGLLVNPMGMEEISDDRVLICDEGAGVVKVFSQIGVHRDNFGYSFLDQPTAVTSDSFGNLWVCDAGLNQIFCFAPNGEYLYSIGEKGREGLYSFDSPADLAVLPGNRLIVSDKNNDRLLVYEILYPE